MKAETRLLVQSLQACQHRVDKLSYSLDDRLNMLPAEASHVIDTFKSIQNYLKLKQLL